MERKLVYTVPPEALLNGLDRDARFTIVPLTAEIIRLSLDLTAINEIHDRQIVATALWLRRSEPELTLITNDRMIADSGIVPVVW